MHVISAYDPK